MEKQPLKEASEPLIPTEKQPILSQQPQVVYVDQTNNIPPAPKSHLVYAVFVTLCCFWPLGVFAVYKEIEARRLYQSQNFQAARQSSKDGLLFSHIALCIGLLGNLIGWGIAVITNGIVFGVLAALGAFSGNATTTEATSFYDF